MDRKQLHFHDLPFFFAESTLGRLAKWLRLAGFDVVSDHGVPEVNRFLRLAQDAQRIILTRTQRVFKALDSDTAIFIRHNHIEAQLRQVMQVMSIQPDDLRPLTICAICNRRLIPAAKADLRGRVPEHIWHQHETFLECPQCRKIYWSGTHADVMRKSMRRWFVGTG